MKIIKPVKGFTKKIAALVCGPRAAVGFVCTIPCGVLGAGTTVITRIARRISLGVWALRKKFERFEGLFEQGLIQLRLHAHAVRLVKKCTDYFKRMQIEETFRDLKSQYFNIEKMRLKKFSRVEILLSLVIMAYNVCDRVRHLSTKTKKLPAQNPAAEAKHHIARLRGDCLYNLLSQDSFTRNIMCIFRGGPSCWNASEHCTCFWHAIANLHLSPCFYKELARDACSQPIFRSDPYLDYIPSKTCGPTPRPTFQTARKPRFPTPCLNVTGIA